VAAALVFAAVPVAPTPRLRARLASLERPFVVAADAGAATALAFGITPDLVLGDFDSLDPSILSQLNVPIETHPRDKDATDGQLAIDRALQHKPTELYLVGFLGGPRLDHALANILLLTRIAIPTVLLDERNECRLLRPGPEHVWRPEPSEVISLIPLSDHVPGIRTRGLRWPLSGATLVRGDTRGVSNEPATPEEDEASVSLASGLLLLTRHFV
jgi:thiamine pyrophosphokinase